MSTQADLKAAEDALFQANMAGAPGRRELLKRVETLRAAYAREVNGGASAGRAARPAVAARPVALAPDPRPGEKALSVRQPWAALIIMGEKMVENRSFPVRYRGPLIIHAAKTLSVKSWSEAIEGDTDDLPPIDALPLGAAVGRVELVDCVLLEDVPDDADPGGFAQGEWCWLLRDPRPFARPIPAKGALNLWTWK